MRERIDRRVRTGVLVLSLAALGLTALAPGAAAQSSSSCPTFRVLHSDRIGNAVLPAGTYGIAPTGITCEAASQRFTHFLEDWDGRLPGGWRVVPNGSGNATFTRTGQSFTVTRGGSGSGGNGGSTRGLACPTSVTIPARDRIGPLVIPRGRYRIVRLSPHAPSCSRANTLLGQFLFDFDGGPLPGGWVVLAQEGAFVNGSAWNGFRLEPFTGTGGSATPAKNGVVRCNGTFRVLNNDRIGSLRFPRGNYYLSLLRGSRGLTCAQASSRFRTFLSMPGGNLPSPWVMSTSSGSFRRGRTSNTGFQAKPAFRVR